MVSPLGLAILAVKLGTPIAQLAAAQAVTTSKTDSSEYFLVVRSTHCIVPYHMTTMSCVMLALG